MILDLSGTYELTKDRTEKSEGHLPGCTYLDYMATGMPDPFCGVNENAAHDLGHHDYRYERAFDVPSALLEHEHIELVCEGVDTVCTISVNGLPVGSTANAFRTYRFDIREQIRPGDNTIRFEFEDPYRFIEEEAPKHPHFPYNKGNTIIRYIRKPACNFGWDWGPKLCPSGVTGSLYVEAYDVRIADVRILQRHSESAVSLEIRTELSGKEEACSLSAVLIHPDGSKQSLDSGPDGTMFFEIEKPRLWWPNGLGEQPLYTLKVRLLKEGNPIEETIKRIGLRTIELDRSRDGDGEQFRFIVNGVPIFAKGADWIPPDQFVTRFTREDMEFYISECSKAHFNMLRVWGGGYYGTEDFYDMCDKYGILVWQDFMFACNLYPFDDRVFLENCRMEIRDNVRRLRHRASLALWCGNNEIEALTFFIRDPMLKVNLEFFHRTLPAWTAEDDPATPYWPGSPSSGHMDGKVHDFRKGHLSGDSHLWNIWHGMLPIEKFSSFPTRFCSEFGMESMPSFKTVRMFHPDPDPELFDEVMQLHQKSGGGNAKILYYMLAKYNAPERFEDFIYLSQLVQADTVRYATECWKRKIGKQNGALFWQLNDTYPVASWSSIDYYRQLKAVQYRARHFNKMLMVSNDYRSDRFDLYVINEYPESRSVKMEVELKDFSGAVTDRKEFDLSVGGVSSRLAATYRFSPVMNGTEMKRHYVRVRLFENGVPVDEKTYLPVEDKKAELRDDPVDFSVRREGRDAVVTMRCSTFKRYVYIDSELTTAPWSDNFFDLEPETEKEVRVDLQGADIGEFGESIRIKDLSAIRTDRSAFRNSLLRTRMFLKDKNWLTYVIYKLILS